MKSGGPWNLRGLRPETVAAAREAARRSGVSVGEWLNELIEQSDDYGRASLRPADHRDENEYDWPDQAVQDDYRGSGRSRPPRRNHDYVDDGAAARDELSDVYDRLDRLTAQIEQLARGKPALRGAPTPPHRTSRLGGAVAYDRGSAAPADKAASSASEQPDLLSPATAPQLAAETDEPEHRIEFPDLEEQL